MHSLLKINTLLFGRSAGSGTYKRVAIFFSVAIGIYWLYVVFTAPLTFPDRLGDDQPVMMEGLIFVMVFDAMLVLARLAHDAWVERDHLTLFPISLAKKAGYLVTVVSLDIKSGVYLASVVCLTTFCLFHGLIARAAFILLVFGVAYLVTCAWEVTLLLFLDRCLPEKRHHYAQGLMVAWMLALVLLNGYVPGDILVRLPFVSTFHRALLAVLQSQYGFSLLQVTILVLYIIPATFFIILLMVGGDSPGSKPQIFHFFPEAETGAGIMYFK